VTDEITLTSQDPTIFVVCDKCNELAADGTYGNYYGASFTKQQWKQGQVCPNCEGELRIIRRIKVTK
jgi:ribosomal protein L37AE/L43A